MKTVKDLTGQKFNNLVVLSRASSNRSGNATWVCLCECCGNENFIASSDHLTRKVKPIKSCGCIAVRKGPKHSQWKGFGEISGNWWHSHVLRERKQNVRVRVPVTIDVEYAWNLFLSQGRKCSLSGIPLVISGTGRENTASLDRIDSSKGYEVGNVQWVHKDVNFMKRTYSQEYFLEMCKRIAENENNKIRIGV
jgi:hypothetical protein